MSNYKLIEREKNPSGYSPGYDSLDHDRESVFIVSYHSQDQYGNKWVNELLTTPNLSYAKKFLRSCRLIEGIEHESV